MFRSRHPHALVSLVILTGLAAQEAIELPRDLNVSRIPLHTGPDDPDGGPYGLWAAGAGYKASFHDGFSFYPYRGADRPTVRLHWRTESVRRGSADLFERAPIASTSTWRHELDYGGVTEAYDILTEGVEQSFVLHRAPATPGDIVVVGRVSSDLEAPLAAAAVQDLTFSDDGQPVVSYGRAVAFDATGRRVDVTTEFDGERIRLRLAGSAIENAVYPVTIDPLTSPVQISQDFANGPVLRTAVATGWGKVLVVLSRRWSSTDTDAYGYLCDPDFTNAMTVWSDMQARWLTTELDVSHVGRESRFVVGFQRDFNATEFQVRAYLHDDNNTTLNSGVMLHTTPPRGSRRQRPQVGGMRGDSGVALIVCEEDPIGPVDVLGTKITSILIDVTLGQVGAAHDLGSISSSHDGRRPSVTPMTHYAGFPQQFGPYDWIAVWSEFHGRAGLWEVRAARVFANGHQGPITTLHSSTDVLDAPKVAGSWHFPENEGRFMAAWIRRTSGFAGRIEIERFDTAGSGFTQFGVQARVLSSFGILSNLDLAHDRTTRSHWAFTYSTGTLSGSTAHVMRVGGTGGELENQVLHGVPSERPGELSIAFSHPSGTQSRFLCSYGREDALHTVQGREFLYAADAGTTRYGTGCGGLVWESGPPFAGNELYGIHVGSVWPEVTFLVIGAQPTDLPTQFPGCRLYVSPLVVLTAGAPIGQTPFFPLPLPDAPVFLGNLYMQVFIVAASTRASDGLKVQIR